jgi:hypothetical protein
MQPPSKKLKPYSFLNPQLKRMHEDDHDDEEEGHKKIMDVLPIRTEVGRMAIRRTNVLQVLTELGFLTINRRPTPQEIFYAFNTYRERYPNDPYITQEEFYHIAVTSNISNGGRRKKYVVSSKKRSMHKKRSMYKKRTKSMKKK